VRDRFLSIAGTQANQDLLCARAHCRFRGPSSLQRPLRGRPALSGWHRPGDWRAGRPEGGNGHGDVRRTAGLGPPSPYSRPPRWPSTRTRTRTSTMW